MSLLNVFPMGQDMVVSVDSMGVSEDGHRHHVQKLFLLPLSMGVLACTGEQSKLPPALAGQYLTERWGTDFDGILDSFPALVQKCHDELKDHLRGAGDLDQYGQELVLVGYSPRRARNVCVVAERLAGEGVFRFAEKEGGHVRPDPGFDPSTKQCDNVFELCWMTAAAQAQRERRKDPNFPIGGHITVAIVRQNRVIVSYAGRA